MRSKRHPLTSIRISTFVALLAVAGLVLGIAALRGGGSASEPKGPEATLSTTSAARTVAATSGASQIYSSTHQGVVKITTDNGLGTGVVLDSKGDILTNDHVVAGANRLRVAFDSGSSRSARLVGSDPSSDLAVVKIDPSGLNLHPLALGSSSTLKVGDTVYAIGNPFGYTNSFSEGIVSGLHRSMTAPNGFTIGDSIQTDAAINPGNSGGPLLDANGNVVGINAQIASSGATANGEGQNNGVGFAIPIDTAKRVIGQLESSGHVSHAYLGVATSDASSSAGALVGSVQPGGPADSAGMRAGDVIVKIGGHGVGGSADVAAQIAAHRPGDKVSIEIRRGGGTRTLTVTLAQQPSQAPTG